MSELDSAIALELAKVNKSYLFYGPGGSGKTTLAVNHPGVNKLWLDVDDKLAEMENLTKQQQDRIKIWTTGESLIGNPNEIGIVTVDPSRKNPYGGSKITTRPAGYDKIVKVTNELLDLARGCKRDNKPFPYDVVVLDTLTRTVQHMSQLVMFQHNVSLITETLYEVVKRNTAEYVSGFLKLPCDRIIIAHSMHKDKRDREGNILESKTKPMVIGTFADEIVSYFSEAYYFKGRGVANKYYIQTAANSELPARTTKSLDFEQEIDIKKIFG